jgi:hypothetical protein
VAGRSPDSSGRSGSSSPKSTSLSSSSLMGEGRRTRCDVEW